MADLQWMTCPHPALALETVDAMAQAEKLDVKDAPRSTTTSPM